MLAYWVAETVSLSPVAWTLPASAVAVVLIAAYTSLAAAVVACAGGPAAAPGIWLANRDASTAHCPANARRPASQTSKIPTP